MAGVKSLVALAFAGCIGLTFLVLACALPEKKEWWPLFVLVFYFLSPLPLLIASRMRDAYGGGGDGQSNACVELSLFATTSIVVSAFGLPIVLGLAGVIKYWACALVEFGNFVSFLAIYGWFHIQSQDDGGWSHAPF